jgi:cold shock protein
MASGTIKFFNANKGFGFVTPDGGGADIFLPAATLTVAGIAKIQPGQRVTFEQGPDKKGPKVVSLQLLGEQIARAPASAPSRVTVYCDPTSDATADVLQAVHDGGFQPQLIDYTVTTLTPDQLRHLSHLLSGSGKSLARRHDPLFSALQLDDRFIGDHELWTAIAEHPSLINGPVLVVSGRARVCKSRDEARNFLNNNDDKSAGKPKALSPRMAALIRGETSPVEVPADTSARDQALRAPMTDIPAAPREDIPASPESATKSASPAKARTKRDAPKPPANPKPAAAKARSVKADKKTAAKPAREVAKKAKK